ncbi:MAG: glycosyltransferase family 4 protein [Prochloraceae cyanobacterium]
MKILTISSTFPYPANKGESQTRTLNLLKYLQSNHEISLVTLRSPEVSEEDIEKLQELVNELAIFPASEKPETEKEGLFSKVKRFRKFLQEGTPPQVLSAYSPGMQEWIDEAVKNEKFDAIVCEDSINEIYIRSGWSKRLKTVINIHHSVYAACKYDIETGASEREFRDRIDLPLLRRYEEDYCSKFNDIVTATIDDRKQIKALVPDAKIKVVPNGIDLNLFPMRSANSGGQRLIIIGEMDRPANIEGARFFSLEVFPEIRKRYPETTLDIVGDRPVDKVLELGEIDGIKVKNRVPSLIEYLHWATVCVLPIPRKFGFKMETLQAMAAGIPVVGSDRALEDLKVDGAGVPLRSMRANEVDEYVYAIGRLFSEPKLREKLSENARKLVEKEYTWEKMGKRYEQVLLDN